MRKGILTIAIALSLVTAGYADVIQVAPGYFAAGIKKEEFEFFAAQQRKPNWCWAACVQMVLNYHGLMVAQEEAVQRIFGGLVDAPGQPVQILAALSGWAPDARGRFSAIYASPYVLSGSQIVQDLGFKWPLIVGLRNLDGGGGHALVLTAVYYRVGPYNEPIFDKVVLRDPWPSNPSRFEVSWDEFVRRTMFMARVGVQRL